eukprot:CAMPEP_0174739606 /NCGR_PEP_ID=MMETSP1094-20130205/71890_1 /TAXON_ID=156173 /ORGANISM="Chrysochromulina brevifilum, Strain UTEX LB 985" /LENGTH=51 /DNA_ID=CAMNT_0015943189 /DNA_START=246 /DNA_END=398 /DNA_ORIENTATION=+
MSPPSYIMRMWPQTSAGCVPAGSSPPATGRAVTSHAIPRSPRRRALSTSPA